MRPQAPIDAVGPGIGRSNMAADIGTVDLHGRVQDETCVSKFSASRSLWASTKAVL
jgi:hypothetical protein